MASGRGRGGIRRWRDWLRRGRRQRVPGAGQRSNGAERNGAERNGTERNGAERNGAERASAEGAGTPPSLDHVLRQAAEAREAARHNPSA